MTLLDSLTFAALMEREKDRLVTLKELAGLLHRDRWTVRRWLKHSSVRKALPATAYPVNASTFREGYQIPLHAALKALHENGTRKPIELVRPEKCARCSRLIGPKQTACLWHSEIVCLRCSKRVLRHEKEAEAGLHLPAGLRITVLEGDGGRFTRLFDSTWRKLPLWARGRLSGLVKGRPLPDRAWREGPVPTVFPEIVVTETAGRREGECAKQGRVLRFKASLVDRLSDADVECLIALELARVMNPEFEIAADGRRVVFSDSEFAEERAEEEAESWGFDVDGCLKRSGEALKRTRHWVMIQAYHFAIPVVGTSHYQDALNVISGGNHILRWGGSPMHRWGCLIHEDTNPHDSKAVSVEIGGMKVGYLSREHARGYRDEMAIAGLAGKRAYCLAEIYCGGLLDSSEYQRWFGVTVFLGSVAEA